MLDEYKEEDPILNKPKTSKVMLMRKHIQDFRERTKESDFVEIYQNLKQSFEEANLVAFAENLKKFKKFSKSFVIRPISEFQRLDITNILVTAAFGEIEYPTNNIRINALKIIRTITNYSDDELFPIICEYNDFQLMKRIIECIEGYPFIWHLLPTLTNIMTYYDEQAYEFLSAVNIDIFQDLLEDHDCERMNSLIEFLWACAHYQNDDEHFELYIDVCKRYLLLRYPDMNSLQEENIFILEDELDMGDSYEEVRYLLQLLTIVVDNPEKYKFMLSSISNLIFFAQCCLDLKDKVLISAIKFIGKMLTFSSIVPFQIDLMKYFHLFENEDLNVVHISLAAFYDGIRSSEEVFNAAVDCNYVEYLTSIYENIPYKSMSIAAKAIAIGIIEGTREKQELYLRLGTMSVLRKALSLEDADTVELILIAIMAFPNDVIDLEGNILKVKQFEEASASCTTEGGEDDDFYEALWENESMTEVLEKFMEDPIMKSILES